MIRRDVLRLNVAIFAKGYTKQILCPTFRSKLLSRLPLEPDFSSREIGQEPA